MAAQAPWRVAGAYRRAVDIATRHDPLANDPSATKAVKAFRRERLRNSPLIAREAMAPKSHDPRDVAAAVLRDAMASSDDHEATFHGGTKWR